MRSKSRELAFQLIFERLFTESEKAFDEEFFVSLKKEEDVKFCKQIVNEFCKNRKELEKIVSENLIGYELSRVYKVDLALIFEAICEIKYISSPTAVVINEVVELAKKYSTEKSSRFVNGVLSAICKKI